MRILVLGGTRFVGRHFVEAATAAGHEVTLFHRGQSGGDLFPDLPRIQGDRLADLEKAQGQTWDAVADMCGYFPRAIELTRGLDAHRYLFISTISVYAVPPDRDDEDAAQLPEVHGTEEINGETYGGLKVACERVAREVWGDRLWIVRPGLVVGPYDPTNRFDFWVNGVREPGFAGPPNLAQPIQWVDGRDLAAFCVHGLEQGHTETVHTVGDSMPFRDFLNRAAAAQGVTWEEKASDDPEDGRPLVASPDWEKFFSWSSARARKIGYQPRTLEATLSG